MSAIHPHPFCARAVCAALALSAVCASAREWRDKWVFVSKSFSDADVVTTITKRINDARAAGFNGLVLGTGCGIENVDRWDTTRLNRLRQVKAAAEAAGLEIIPVIWSVGYGSLLGRDPNLAAALPVNDEPFVMRSGVAARETEASLTSFANGGFEQRSGAAFPGWSMLDTPITAADTTVFADGATSVKLTPNTANKNARACQIVTLTPNRNYEFSCRFKTAGFPTGKIALQVYRLFANGSSQTMISQLYFSDIPETTDWVRRAITFNPGDSGRVRIYAGAWNATSGTLWLDDARLEPVTPLADLVRRAGTPLSVKNADTPARVYTEGTDYRVTAANGANQIEALASGSLADGDRVLVSYFHRAVCNNNQASLCMSAPEIYDLFHISAAAIARELAPRTWLLAMDEIRNGGTCAACRARGTDMAHILGDCVTRQHAIIRAVAPAARIYIWSDMFYPGHNAVANYHNCRGSFADAWKYVPKDITFVCWSNSMTAALPFFDQLGFRTLAAAYYDSNLATCATWLEVCQSANRCTGLMYTTWKNNYSLLPDFGRLIADSAPVPPFCFYIH